jgi:putative transposase
VQPRVSSVIPLTPQAIRRVGHRYGEGGLERALYEKQRPGAAALLEDSLVAEEAVKRKLLPRVGRETIRILLLHHDLKPWREKNVVHRRPQ